MRFPAVRASDVDNEPMTQPSTQVSRLSEKQEHRRAARSTRCWTARRWRPSRWCATAIRSIFPTGFARVGRRARHPRLDGVAVDARTGGGAPAAVSVTTLDGVVVARSAFESSFRYRSAALFGVFEPVPDDREGRLSRMR